MEPNRLDRFNYNPLVATLAGGYLVSLPFTRGFNWFTIIGLIVGGLWLLGSWANFLSRGRLLEWIFSDEESSADDDESDGPPANLAQAIQRGIAEGGSLSTEIRRLHLDEITSPADASMLCSALQEFRHEGSEKWRPLLQLTLRPGSAEVHRMFARRALPLLHEILRYQIEHGDPDDSDKTVLLLRPIIAYGYSSAFRDLAHMSRDPRFSGSYYWDVAFRSADEEDEKSFALHAALADPFPHDYALVAYLDWTNKWCLENQLESHSFDCEAGVAQLEKLLSDPDAENSSSAVSAAVTIAFLTHEKTGSLLALARDHPNPDVQVEAAWALARRGKAQGIRDLVAAARHWKTGATAVSYLEELGLRDEIPPEAHDPKHAALCQMARWLAHPNELGACPESLTLVDQREIVWPPTGERILQSQIRWKLHDDEGIGLTGSVTWCFFGEQAQPLEVLDLYAMHCNWELQRHDDPRAPKSYRDLAVGRELLSQANPEEDWTAKA